jgi:hypothetical protein
MEPNDELRSQDYMALVNMQFILVLNPSAARMSREAQEQTNPSVSVITTNSENMREKHLWKWSQNC